jgi:hypothetical protein
VTDPAKGRYIPAGAAYKVHFRTQSLYALWHDDTGNLDGIANKSDSKNYAIISEE